MGSGFAFCRKDGGGWLHSFAYAGVQGWRETEAYWEYLMRIHFAEASKDRGQLHLLASEAGTQSLFSFAYNTPAFYEPFERYWNELVRIHLAGLPSANTEIQSAVLPQIESQLTTYAHPFEVQAKEKAFELMRIHLADTTARLHGDRSIKELLPQEEKTENLLSYAYEDQEEQWRDSWNHAMNIHLAGHSASPEMESTVKPEHDAHLTTYTDRTESINTVNAIVDRVDLRPRVIIDSGAFTAWSTGKVIDPRDYAKWAIDFDDRWRSKMASLEFMNLDVIGDQDATWTNQRILEGLGLKPLPIITFGVDLKHLDRALAEYDYIALGGLVPYTRDKAKLRAWLDACFSRVMKYKKTYGIMRRIHLLGVTTDWVLKRYPCYSSDSSSWVSCLRFGGGTAAGIKKLPRYKESSAAMSATIHVLRSEIRKYKQMQEEVTNLWASRGIKWD